MSSDIRDKAILNAAGIAVLAVMFCVVGCYDLGIEPSVPTPTVETFVDGRDGRTYKKVKIGTQTWMAENLKYEADGSVCYDRGYGNRDTAYFCEMYGRLYDWNTAMDYVSSSDGRVEGVCPVNWHIPSDAEWTILTNFVGLNAGTKLKSTTWWDRSPGAAMNPVPIPAGTDIYGFSALPGGTGEHQFGNTGDISFFHDDWSGYWWSSTETESSSDEVWVRVIYGSQTYVLRWHTKKYFFLSVRCVHD